MTPAPSPLPAYVSQAITWSAGPGPAVAEARMRAIREHERGARDRMTQHLWTAANR